MFLNGHESMNIRVRMKVLVVLCLFAGLAAAKPQDTYTTKYDNIDIDDILANDRLYINYFNCLLGEGKCTDDAKLLKEAIPDALQNECSKCSDKQKAGGEIVIKFMVEKKPEDFKKLEAIYDPDRIYRKKYNEEAEKRGIKLIE